MVASFQFRTLFAIMGSCGMAIIYGFKVNLSVAIVAMINNTAIKEINLQVENTISSEFNQSFNSNSETTLVCQTIQQKDNSARNTRHEVREGRVLK